MKLDSYLEQIEDYYELYDSESFLKRILLCIDDCLNLIDIEEFYAVYNINSLRNKAREIISTRKNFRELLNNIQLEFSQNVKPYTEMTEQECMIYRAICTLLYYPLENDWMKYEKLTHSINFILSSGIDAKDVEVVIHNHFSDLLINQ